MTRFLAVAEVYAPFEETEGDLQGDIGEVDQNLYQKRTSVSAR